VRGQDGGRVTLVLVGGRQPVDGLGEQPFVRLDVSAGLDRCGLGRADRGARLGELGLGYLERGAAVGG